MTHRFRCTLPGLAQDMHHTSREFLTRLGEGMVSLEAWRWRRARPPQYQVVSARAERRDHTWEDVMSAEARDRDARAVHVWLDARMDALRRPGGRWSVARARTRRSTTPRTAGAACRAGSTASSRS